MSLHRHAPGQWTADEVDPQQGRTVVVTGASSGLGFEVAKVLSARGAQVVLACRDPHKAAAAAARIVDEVPHAKLAVVQLDLASLASVSRAAEQIRIDFPRLDLLINNAGVMMPPLGYTEDGFELQIGINHLGHFALTGLLLDSLLATSGSRVVTVSSSAHRQGGLDLDDLQFRSRCYSASIAYSQSKLANVLFTYELQRRLAAAGMGTIALALEPGFVPTELQRHVSGAIGLGVTLLTRLIGQSDASAGALGTLRAATDPSARGGQYFAPSSWLMRASRAYPVPTRSSEVSYSAELQARLWVVSERLTGITFNMSPAVAP